MNVWFLCISVCRHYLDTYSDYTDNVQIVFISIFIYYSDKNILFALYIDNMCMVFVLFTTLFPNNTNLASWSYCSSMHGLSLLHRGWCCPSFLFICLPLQALLFLFTSLLFHCLPGLVLFLLIIFFCSSHLLVVFSWKRKREKC